MLAVLCIGQSHADERGGDRDHLVTQGGTGDGIHAQATTCPFPIFVAARFDCDVTSHLHVIVTVHEGVCPACSIPRPHDAEGACARRGLVEGWVTKKEVVKWWCYGLAGEITARQNAVVSIPSPSVGGREAMDSCC